MHRENVARFRLPRHSGHSPASPDVFVLVSVIWIQRFERPDLLDQLLTSVLIEQTIVLIIV